MISLSTGELEQHIISLPQHVLYHLFILFFFSARMTAFGDDKRGCLGVYIFSTTLDSELIFFLDCPVHIIVGQTMGN